MKEMLLPFVVVNFLYLRSLSLPRRLLLFLITFLLIFLIFLILLSIVCMFLLFVLLFVIVVAGHDDTQKTLGSFLVSTPRLRIVEMVLRIGWISKLLAAV
jgi:hypothetical protein